MLTASVILFMYAVLSGLVMAISIFSRAKRWAPLALGHGVLAATALVLAVLESITNDVAPIKYGVAILITAALGGLLLLSYPLRGKPHPRVVVLLHALLAVGGVGCLVFALLH
jgi:peptidoglycan/LPS O-acetylase OafA/YrhL